MNRSGVTGPDSRYYRQPGCTSVTVTLTCDTGQLGFGWSW